MNKLKRNSFFVFVIALNFVKAHVAYVGVPNHLHQVQSLYVKPSSDGTSGDLYVAATEDSPVKQWLDQPINYLQAPVSYTTSLTTTNVPGETIVANQKRAVLAAPPIKYAYALPAPTDGSTATAAAIPYPYALPTSLPTTEGSECADKTAHAATPFYPYPLHLYYSQMMSAFANAFHNAAKDSNNEEGTSAAAKATVPATWPSYYPFQYVMVDPTAWAQAAAASASPVQTSTPKPNTSGAATATSSASNESD